MIFGNFTPDYLRVNLIWDNLHIDNSTLDGSAGQDSAVFQIKGGDKTTNQVTVFLKGENVLTGNGNVYTETTDGTTTTSLPGGVIEAQGTGSDRNGSVYITGGTILVYTTQTGIKYNGGGGGMGGGSGSSDAATSDGQYIIGAPGDNSRP